MDDHAIKANVLKDIMRAMMARDGGRLRPKPAAVGVPSAVDGALKAPGMAEGGEVTDDHLHFGADSDISKDDSEILSQLWDKGQGSEEHNEAEEADEDDEAGKD